MIAVDPTDPQVRERVLAALASLKDPVEDEVLANTILTALGDAEPPPGVYVDFLDHVWIRRSGPDRPKPWHLACYGEDHTWVTARNRIATPLKRLVTVDDVLPDAEDGDAVRGLLDDVAKLANPALFFPWITPHGATAVLKALRARAEANGV